MLPTLMEMESLGLLTRDEATEANSYASNDPQTWMTMPAPLMHKVWAAWKLLEFEPQEIPHLPMH